MKFLNFKYFSNYIFIISVEMPVNFYLTQISYFIKFPTDQTLMFLIIYIYDALVKKYPVSTPVFEL
jgi:hypothetical protein